VRRNFRGKRERRGGGEKKRKCLGLWGGGGREKKKRGGGGGGGGGVRHVACMGGNRNLYSVVVEKPERKMPLVRITCMWYDIIKMDLIFCDSARLF